MINRVILVGRLTRDPMLRKTQSGLSVATFTVACDRRFSGGNGQDRQTDFISCVQLLESKSASENRSATMGYQPQNAGYAQANPFGDATANDGFDDFSAGPTQDISSDDLPF